MFYSSMNKYLYDFGNYSVYISLYDSAFRILKLLPINVYYIYECHETKNMNVAL